MTDAEQKQLWASGDAYEPYVGRWSRLVAREFVAWLNVPSESHWLDVGCGTGALTQTILATAAPQTVRGADQSAVFIDHARQRTPDARATFEVADAQSLPVDAGSVDAAVSGLVLNFVPKPERMVSEMARATRSDGIIALYVWDYAGEMQMMRHFWDAAAALDPAARQLDEGTRFPICNPQAMRQLFVDAGLRAVETRAIDVPTHFRDFDDYWQPFLGGQAPAPAYAMSLEADQRAALRDTIRAQLPIQSDGSIQLMARAWAVCGRR